MAYEQERESGRDVQQDLSKDAFQEFVAGLHVMSTDFDRCVQNFAWCAGQIAGDPNSSAQLRGMMEFVLKLHEFGLERAIHAVEKDSGLPVSVNIPDIIEGQRAYDIKSPTVRKRPGIIAGLVGASYINEEKLFEGVAVMKDRRGREAFVAVWISPEGETTLRPKEAVLKRDTLRAGLLKELYPHTTFE